MKFDLLFFKRNFENFTKEILKILKRKVENFSKEILKISKFYKGNLKYNAKVNNYPTYSILSYSLLGLKLHHWSNKLLNFW